MAVFYLCVASRDSPTDYKFYQFIGENFRQAFASSQFGVSESDSPKIDIFGITKLYPTVDGGREWLAKWDNGIARTLKDEVDPYDSEFNTSYGEGTYHIDGEGSISVSGPYPRMYVVDPAEIKKWQNVEITFYGKRVAETEPVSWAGLQAYARTAHLDSDDRCTYRGYGGQMLYDGKIRFEKEINHHIDHGYSDKATVTPWSDKGPMPKNVWIGYKLVVKNINDDTAVKLELYRDMTDGENGGRWMKMTEHIDAGGWGEDSPPCAPTVEPTKILLDPDLSIYIRNDGIEDAEVQKV